MIKKLLLLVSVAMLLIISPAVADIDTFTIHTVYGSPTDYTIDYGQYTTANVYNYSIESSVVLAANQSWLLLGSNNNNVIDTLDTMSGVGFTAAVIRNFTVSTPGNYRYYYLVLNTGFYDPSTTLTLKLYSTTISTMSPYVTTTTEPAPRIPMLPAAKKESPPYQFVSDNLIWVVIVLVVIVGLLVMRRR
jgi:hypothetical protein